MFCADHQEEPDLPEGWGELPAGMSCMFAPVLTWSANRPSEAGWYWVEATYGENKGTAIRRVDTERAFGNRLCVFIPVRGWVPVDDPVFDEVPWRFAGPIPKPQNNPSVP